MWNNSSPLKGQFKRKTPAGASFYRHLRVESIAEWRINLIARNKSKGFTLIELLVVIAIIAILAAILFPVFASVRSKAKLTHCTNNVMQIVRGVKAYCTDWGGYCVPGGWSYAWGSGLNWTERILPYLTDEAVYKCPQTGYYFSYGLNYAIVMPVPGNDIGGYQLDGSINEVRSPGKCVMVFEYNPDPKIYPGYFPAVYDKSTADPDITNDTQLDGDVYSPSAWPYWLRFPGPHPGGSQPIGFVDGHVKVFNRWDPNSITFNPGKSF